MSRPAPNEKDTKSLRRIKARANGQVEPPTALLEAYKKHVEELRGIEDRQNKTKQLHCYLESSVRQERC